MRQKNFIGFVNFYITKPLAALMTREKEYIWRMSESVSSEYLGKRKIELDSRNKITRMTKYQLTCRAAAYPMPRGIKKGAITCAFFI